MAPKPRAAVSAQSEMTVQRDLLGDHAKGNRDWKKLWMCTKNNNSDRRVSV